MPEFFPMIEIRGNEAEAIARGLFAVAKADGTMHEREAALIAEFVSEVVEAAPDLAALERSPRIEPDALALMLPSKELRQLFLKTAMLLAYADSSYGVAESKLIGEFAGALGVSNDDLKAFEGQVKEYMLSQFTHIQNTEAVAEVAKSLKV